MVTLAENAGFCFGVKRAADMTERLLTEPGLRIYTLGDLIHNRTYLASLAKRGVTSVAFDKVEEIARSTETDGPAALVIRAHGIPREHDEILGSLSERYPDFYVYDMTCPNVKKIHKIAAENTGDDTFFLLYGAPDHPEPIGIMSYAKGQKAIFTDESELERILRDTPHEGKRLVFASQTTQNLPLWKKTQKKVQKLYTNSIFFDTICSVTENRQKEAIALAEQSDCMIVIGSRESSNTRHLFDLCKTKCPETYLIESVDQLPDVAKKPGSRTSITAGASTPGGIITEVYQTMEEKLEIENFEEMLNDSLKTLHTGETVTGIVTAIDATGIYLDLGTKQTGFIAAEQLSAETDKVIPAKMFNIGDEVKAFVIRVNDGDGMITLSKKRVDADKSWISIEEAYNEGTVLEGKVTEIVKGGLVIAIDKHSIFIPASHSGIPKDGDLNVLLGTTQRFKLIELDDTRKRALGSIRIVKRAERAEAEAALWSTLEVGQHFKGTVKNLTSYGAFVDIGGIDGMVHNSELSWKRIKHPSQVVSVGQEIDVYIKELDPEKKRISLGYKTEDMDVFSVFAANHNEGDVVEAKIVSIMPFGAFAEVADGVDGLIHISRLSREKVAKPEDVVSIGQVVNVKITEIDRENRKLGLSIRAIEEEKARAEEAAAREAEKAEREAAEKAEAEEKAAERAEMEKYITGVIE
ncbi:MAG: bifunctional 4-hydroxy-3-methylbut-2-enyl diphosphate reductase/30S ribosomal protein S1 [Clostridia bacterium]|nr:bifunctional 4-hydroxy-3-methylbut-2-enyl diphosphate reductase/30S ribosomal protein S1 [Clostridia bacterium]